jgi:hypothetical protein
VLDQRRKIEKHRSNDEYAARQRGRAIEKYRQQKSNSGYVMLIVYNVASTLH